MAKRINIRYKVEGANAVKELCKTLKALSKIITELEKKGIKIKVETEMAKKPKGCKGCGR